MRSIETVSLYNSFIHELSSLTFIRRTNIFERCLYWTKCQTGLLLSSCAQRKELEN